MFLRFTSLILQVTNFKTNDCLPKTLVNNMLFRDILENRIRRYRELNLVGKDII
jgi:hypothetical protein